MALFGDGGQFQVWEVMITTVAAAMTPYLAFRFRERRARKPKTPTEALYQYYENYINRLEDALAKKDIIINAQDQQIKEQQAVVSRLQEELNVQRAQLDERQAQINQLKREVSEMQAQSGEFHTRINELKSQNPDIPTGSDN